MWDQLHEECGVAGVVGDERAAHLIYLALYSLQHRGQEACGIVTLAGTAGAPEFHSHKAFGLVCDGFSEHHLNALPGSIGIGHVRYATQGGHHVQNIQPFSFSSSQGMFAIAPNGNLTNADRLRVELEAEGSIFRSSSDTEVFMHLLARASGSVRERLRQVMETVDGAYSLALIADNTLYAVRDPLGFRPLVIGKKGSAYIVVSETCALDLIEADFVREVAPGEVVELRPGHLDVFRPVKRRPPAFCAFEPIYFSRPDSRIFGQEVYALRRRMGEVLAQEAPAEADVVIAIPDSGVPMTLGFAGVSGLPMELGLVRNHYVGRTFIQPGQAKRDFGVRLKLNPILSTLRGKRVVVVDDSIVRGTTSKKILEMLRSAGVAEIHLRIGSPPITHSCFFGVDTPTRDQLLAAQRDVGSIRRFLGADSLAFLSVEGLRQALGPADEGDKYCYACFTGCYPEDIHTRLAEQPTDAAGVGLQDPPPP